MVVADEWPDEIAADVAGAGDVDDEYVVSQYVDSDRARASASANRVLCVS